MSDPHSSFADKSLSIVIPAYNEAENLPAIIKESFAALDKLSGLVDVVVIDDASNDESPEVLLALQRRYANLRVYRNLKNQGCHPSTLVGWPLADGDYRLFIPADGQIPPVELEKFLLKAIQGYDVIYSWRTERQDPWFRLLLNRCYNAIIHFFLKLPVHDVNSAALLSQDAVEMILPHISSDSAFITVEILLEAQRQGLKIAEVPIEHRPRVNGVARGINLKDLCFVPLNFTRMLFWCFWQQVKSWFQVSKKS